MKAKENSSRTMVFCDVTPCSRVNVSNEPTVLIFRAEDHSLALKMEAAGSFEIFVTIYQSA
jgi:hypothetical protein